ncbi:hypothetical protein CTAM01_17364 [Colletotrichum tamarilloi]|uniref:Uncharacterized protein n=2 Tax=Colletotrichum tamarilloi TaxID=1209934 RepID=A0ABQ9QFX3_9PEZI|nr:uncharacterized protein CTAM01_17364 [Colletotrichum tamarilloi]KAK1446951.1 hypothetical protein CTAM01_17364 [Colletotrichum tamarilloi]
MIAHRSILLQCFASRSWLILDHLRDSATHTAQSSRMTTIVENLSECLNCNRHQSSRLPPSRSVS